MQLLRKFFKRKSVSKGIVAISFINKDMTIAISNFIENQQLLLIHCEFIEAISPESLNSQFSELVARFGLAEYECHLVLTGEHYRRVNVEAPAVAEHEIIEALRWKVNELIDFPIEKAVIDYYKVPMPMRANSSNMLEVIASPIDVLKGYVKQCTDLGLEPSIIDIQETTLRNLAVHTPENEHGIAMLYLTAFSAMLLIQKSGTLYVSRKIDVGYQQLGLEDAFSNDCPTVNVHRKLALEIQRSLDYVESYYKIAAISVLGIIPLAEHSQNLLDSLDQNLGVAARMFDITQMIACDIALNARTQSFCAPVLGATLRYVIEKA